MINLYFACFFNPCLAFFLLQFLGLFWKEEVELAPFGLYCAYERYFLLFRCLCQRDEKFTGLGRRKGCRSGILRSMEVWRGTEEPRVFRRCKVVLQDARLCYSHRSHTQSVAWSCAQSLRISYGDARLPVCPNGLCDLIIFLGIDRGILGFV